LARRQKYRCRCGGCVETALGPEKLMAGGRYSLDFAVMVAVEKYWNHMPLARQVRDLRRHGLAVDTQTLWDQLWALSRHLEPSWEALAGYVREAPVIGADETTWRLMESKGAKKWWAWGICREDAVRYELHPTRSGAAAAALLDDYGGTVIADGYEVYPSLRKQRVAAGAAGFRLAACWAHARRRFVAAEPSHPQAAAILERIGWLYEVDRRGRGGPPGALAALRRSAGQLIVDGIKAELEDLRGRVLPRSSLGTAIRYTLDLWSELTCFLDDPAIPLDNNGTERALRGIALGRKNHYGSRSERGIRVAAIFYSLVESAKLCGLDPAAYLREVALRSIRDPKRPVVLLPHHYRAATTAP
jgi:transposase